VIEGEGDFPPTNTHLVNVAESSLLDTLVLDNLTENTSVTAANDQDLLGVGVGVHGQVGDHLLVRELVSLGALDDIVQNQDVAVVLRLEDQDILVLALLVVKDLLDLQGHGLTCNAATGQRDSSVGVLAVYLLLVYLPAHISEISLNQPSGRC
jgi:hypothetical protein